jgi:hypothetical protein
MIGNKVDAAQSEAKMLEGSAVVVQVMIQWGRIVQTKRGAGRTKAWFAAPEAPT